MTPEERTAIIELFQTMYPGQEREDLLKSIQACDFHEFTAKRHVETAHALATAQTVHDATTERLATAAAAAEEAHAHLLGVLAKHGKVP